MFAQEYVKAHVAVRPTLFVVSMLKDSSWSNKSSSNSSSCLSVCPVCDDGVLWPNGWMDQDETWHDGRPRPRPHCVRLGPIPRLTVTINRD